jgi:hypothetical protein
MTTSDQEDQVEKRGTLLNDARVREQSRNGDTGTYLSHTHSELGGRFAVAEHQTITGVVSPSPPPLPANSPWHGTDPVPDEPPLGYPIDAMPELESPTGVPVSPPVATDDPADAPSSGGGPATPSGGLVFERAGSSPFQTESEIGDPALAPGVFTQHFPASAPRVGPSSVSQKDLDNG